MTITKTWFFDGHLGDFEYWVKQTIYDGFMLLELRCKDEYQKDTQDSLSLHFDPMSNKFDRPCDFILAKVTIGVGEDSPNIKFSMGDAFPDGFPIHKGDFKIIRKFFDLVETHISHPENIERVEIE